MRTAAGSARRKRSILTCGPGTVSGLIARALLRQNLDTNLVKISGARH
jgi:hypothetical protein